MIVTREILSAKAAGIGHRLEQFRGLIIIAGGRLSQMAAQILMIRALTTYLAPEEVGRNYLLLSLASWFSLVLINPVSTYVGRCLLEWNQDGRARMNYLRFWKYASVVAIVAAGLLIIIQKTIGLGVTIRIPFLLWLILGGLLFGSIGGGVLVGLNILARRGTFVVLSNLIVWGGLGFSIFLIREFSANAEFWVTGQLLGQALVIGPAVFLLWRLLSRTSQASLKADQSSSFTLPIVFRFSWPLAISVGLFWLQSEGYRFVLNSVTGEATLGFFAAGYSIGAGLMIAFETLFNQFYQPIFYRAISDKDTAGRAKAWNDYASAYLPTILLVGAFVALGGPFLVRLVAGQKFQGVAPVVAMATIVESFRMVSSAYYMAALAERDMRTLILPGTAGAVVALLGVYLLAPWNPLIGTGLALCLAAASVTVSVGIKLRAAIPIVIPWNRVTLAALLVLPMGLIFFSANGIAPESGKIQAIMILAVTGAYMLATQFILAKKWMFHGRYSTNGSRF